MEWQVIKFSGVLGIDKKDSILLNDYEVLAHCETEREAYDLMKRKASELNIYGMRYKHLQ